MSSLSLSNSENPCAGVDKCFIRPGYVQRGFDAGEVIVVYASYEVYSVTLQNNKCTTISSNSDLPSSFTISTSYSDETSWLQRADATFRSHVNKSTCRDVEDMVTSSTTATTTSASTTAPSVNAETTFSTSLITTTLETSKTTQLPTSSPNSASTALRPEVKIAIGILIPTVLISLLALGIFFWRRRRPKKSNNATKEPSLLAGMGEHFFQTKPELSGEQSRHEMHGEGIQPEMADNPRYELEAHAIRHEMQVEERRQELKV